MAADPALVIRVVRTGGFAGLTREWRVTAGADERETWNPLIEACPWRSIPKDSISRDRFVWRIEVKAPHKRRKAEVPDAALTGPWKELVERVREKTKPTAP